MRSSQRLVRDRAFMRPPLRERLRERPRLSRPPCVSRASDPREWQVEDVQTWVESIGFHEYRGAFEEASIDGRRLLSMPAEKLATELVLAASEHVAVIALEISELRARRGLMSSSELKAHFSAHPPPSSWDGEGVIAWLEDAGMERYAAAFEAAQVDGAALLRMSSREIAMLLSAAPNRMEQNEAAAELLEGLITHLRWRESSGRGAGLKQEL